MPSSSIEARPGRARSSFKASREKNPAYPLVMLNSSNIARGGRYLGLNETNMGSTRGTLLESGDVPVRYRIHNLANCGKAGRCRKVREEGANEEACFSTM